MAIRIIDHTKEKNCSQCGKTKLRSEFHENTGTKGGLQCWCKECVRQYYSNHKDKIKARSKRWHEEHKEEHAEYDRQWREDHKEERAARGKQYREDRREEHAARDKQYYEDNKDRIKARSKQYYEHNKKKCAAQSAQWRRDHPEKKAAYSAKRRALLAGAECDVDALDIELMLQDTTHCPHCGRGTDMPGAVMTIEHIIPVSRGGNHTRDNLQIICKRCNSSKGDKLPSEWTDRWYEKEDAA